MIQKIYKKNKIFDIINSNRNYFSIVIDNLLNEDVQLYSDGMNYLISQINDNSCLIWCRDNIEKNVLSEILNFVSSMDLMVICDNYLYKLICLNYGDFVDFNSVINYKSFVCKGLVSMPRLCGGEIYVPSVYDLDCLCGLYYASISEYDKNNIYTMDYVRDIVNKLIHSGCIYAWKNEVGKIVSVVSYNVKYNEVIIDNIYTISSEKNRGYDANLLATITGVLISENLLPIIYLSIDNNYFDSILFDIGYNNSCLLNQFCINKNKVKRKI